MSSQSEQIDQLATALAKVQKSLKGAVKDAANPFFKSKYADLESVWNACRQPLADNGFCVIQTTDFFGNGAGTCLVTTLAHASGQWVKGILPINAKAQDPQGQGSAVTYARRYGLAAIVGVIQVDDDGESAHGRNSHTVADAVKGLEREVIAATARLTRPPEVVAEQPAENDGLAQTGYRIPFGKYKARSLEEVGIENLKSYINYLEAKARKEGEVIKGAVAEFITQADQFIGRNENADIGKVFMQEGDVPF